MTGPLRPSRSSPLYAQLKDALRERIASGVWDREEPLPGERRLAEEFGVSRPTVRQALADLTAEGMLVRVLGKGTFIGPPRSDPTVGQLLGFAEELRLMGLEPAIAVLGANFLPAPDDIRADFEMTEGAADEVLLVERLVSTGDGPVFVDRTVLPARIGRLLLGFGFERPIFELLEGVGIRLGQGQETLTAEPAAPREAELLQVAPGTPLLRVRRVTRGEDGVPLESSLAHYRGDRYAFRVRLQRTAPT